MNCCARAFASGNVILSAHENCCARAFASGSAHVNCCARTFATELLIFRLADLSLNNLNWWKKFEALVAHSIQS